MQPSKIVNGRATKREFCLKGKKMAAYKIAYGEVWMTNLATNSKPPFFSSDIRICAATDMMAIAYTENDDGDNVERILHKHGESAAVTAWAKAVASKLTQS